MKSIELGSIKILEYKNEFFWRIYYKDLDCEGITHELTGKETFNNSLDAFKNLCQSLSQMNLCEITTGDLPPLFKWKK